MFSIFIRMFILKNLVQVDQMVTIPFPSQKGSFFFSVQS